MVEVLIKQFAFDKAVVLIVPVGCPGEESQDVLLDDSGNPCCCNSNICKYFDSALFDRSEYKKTLNCNYR